MFSDQPKAEEVSPSGIQQLPLLPFAVQLQNISHSWTTEKEWRMIPVSSYDKLTHVKPVP